MRIKMSIEETCQHNQTVFRRTGPNVSGSCKTCRVVLFKSPKVMLWKHGVPKPKTLSICGCTDQTPVEIYRTGCLLNVKCIKCERTWGKEKEITCETSSIMSPALRIVSPKKSSKVAVPAKRILGKKRGNGKSNPALLSLAS